MNTAQAANGAWQAMAFGATLSASKLLFVGEAFSFDRRGWKAASRKRPGVFDGRMSFSRFGSGQSWVLSSPERPFADFKATK